MFLAYQRGEVGKIIPVTTSNTYTHNWANANTDWYDAFFQRPCHVSGTQLELEWWYGTFFLIICPAILWIRKAC